MRSLRVLTVLALACAWTLLGPAPHVSAAQGASNQDALHEVTPGDDLRLIAGYYYGDTRQWTRIWEANRDLVKKPNRIQRGTYLRIPGVVVPAEPYADYVARTRAASAAKAPGIVVPPVPPTSATTPEATPETAEPSPTPAAAPTLPAKTAPAKAAPSAKAAPEKAPAVSSPSVKTTPAPPAPAKAAPEKGPAPAKGETPPQPPAKGPAAATTPAAPAPAKQVAAPPAPPAAKAPAPPVKGPTKAAPPPPPREWYEELLSPEFFASIEFMAGAGVLVLALLGFFLWRRRKTAEGT